MAKERFSITIDKEVLVHLADYMKKHDRNRSNAIEVILKKELNIALPKKQKK